MNININTPSFKLSKSDKIILDTNILLMVFYGKFIQKNISYKKGYQDFVNRCLSNKNVIYTTETNICEALHVIDKISLDLYNNKNKVKIGLKEFHKISSESNKVRKDMEVFYNCIKNAIQIIPNEESDNWLNEYFSNNDALDMYDYYLIYITKNNNIKNILTDDEDFICNQDLISGLNILSQNSKIFNN